MSAPPFDDRPGYVALSMDRSVPLGDSAGDDQRGRLHVKIANKTSEPIPIFSAHDADLVALYSDSGNISPGFSSTLTYAAVPVGQAWDFQELWSSSSENYKIDLKVNGQTLFTSVQQARTSNQEALASPARIAMSGDVVSIVRTNQNSVGAASIYTTLWVAIRSV